MSSSQQLHELVEQLPETEVPAAHRVLQALCLDPVQVSLLTAPYDDEPETEEERRLVEEAREDPSPCIPLGDILREFGLK